MDRQYMLVLSTVNSVIDDKVYLKISYENIAQDLQTGILLNLFPCRLCVLFVLFFLNFAHIRVYRW